MLAGSIVMMLVSQGVFSGGARDCVVSVNSRVVVKDLHADAFSVGILARQGVVAAYIDGVNSCVMLDASDAGCQFSPVTATGRRKWGDVWVTRGDVVYDAVIDGGVVRFSRAESEPCDVVGIAGLSSVCVGSGVVKFDDNGLVVVNRDGGTVAVPLSGPVRTEDPDGSSVLMVAAKDRRRVASVLGPQAVIPHPPFAVGEFSCGSRVCWGVGVDGQIAYISRLATNSSWRVAGQIARWSTGGRSVAVGGEETGLFYDPDCRAVYSAITPHEFMK